MGSILDPPTLYVKNFELELTRKPKHVLQGQASCSCTFTRTQQSSTHQQLDDKMTNILFSLSKGQKLWHQLQFQNLNFQILPQPLTSHNMIRVWLEWGFRVLLVNNLTYNTVILSLTISMLSPLQLHQLTQIT